MNNIVKDFIAIVIDVIDIVRKTIIYMYDKINQ